MYCYAPKMVKYIRSRMSFLIIDFSHLSNKVGRDAKLIGEIDISRLVVYVQLVEMERLRDKK